MRSDPISSDPEKDDRIFSCQQCGDCCNGYGGTYVTDADIRRIANYIKVEPNVFNQRFCQKSGDRLVLVQGDDGFCIFYQEDCSIHAVKPKMCRDWPYIQNLQVDFANWQAMASMCPGINRDASASAVIERVKTVQSKGQNLDSNHKPPTRSGCFCSKQF